MINQTTQPQQAGMKFLLVLSFAALSMLIFSCKSNDVQRLTDANIYTIAEDMPVFPGGEAALVQYLDSVVYPLSAKENMIEGTSFIRFVVDETGKVTHVEVARGADKVLDEAALKHIKNMPEWKPGMQNGKSVKVQFVVPIRFKL